MVDREILDFNVRVEIRDDKKPYFVPEVLVLQLNFDYYDRQVFQNLYRNTQEKDEQIKEYKKNYTQTIEWKVIWPGRGYFYLERRGYKRSAKGAGFRTLSKAKDILNDYKTYARAQGEC